MDQGLSQSTIPPDLPIMYITDSNNAKILQKRVKYKQDLTHRQLVRRVKQGIDYSIANHLELLTSKWPGEEKLSDHTKWLYKRAEEICQTWAKVNIPNNCEPDHDESISYTNDEESMSDSTSTNYSEWPPLEHAHNKKNRSYFDSTMYDLLGKNTTIKVFSHQLNKDFSLNTRVRCPSPNLCIVSANQYADNAATQAHEIISEVQHDYDKIFYPAFSPRWCFSFEGCLINKGATKLLIEKIDQELDLRLQHRSK